MSTQVGAARRAAQRSITALLATALVVVGLGSVAHASASLTAQQQGEHVQLSWSALSEATAGYVVEYSQVAAPTEGAGDGFNETTFAADATSGTSSLPGGGSWYFTVFGKTADGSYVMGGSTGPVPLLMGGPYVTLDEASVTTTSADVSWTGVTDAAGYAVGALPASQQNGVTPTTPGMSEVSGTSTTLTGLTPGTAYTVWVLPLTGDGGWGYYGATALSTTPAAPTGLAAVQQGYRVHASWVAPEGGAAGGYSIAVGPGDGPTPGLDDDSGYAEPDATSADVYYQGLPGAVKVAVYARGSNWSMVSESAVTTLTMRDPELRPDVSVTSSTTSSVTISWTPVEGAVGYRAAILTPAEVEDYDTPMTPSRAGFVDATPPHTFSGLSPDSTYYPYVFPIFEGGGWGSQGAGYAGTRPPGVTALKAVPSSTGDGTTLVSWAYDGTGAQGFTVLAQQGSAPTSSECDDPCVYLGSVDDSARSYVVDQYDLGGPDAMSQEWFFAVFAESAATGAASELKTTSATPWSLASLQVKSYYSEPYFVPATSTTQASYGLRVRWAAPAAPWKKITVTMVRGTTPAASDTTGVIYSCTKSTTNTCAPLSSLKKGLVAGSQYSAVIWTSDAAGNKTKVTLTDLTRAPGVYVNGTLVKGSGTPRYGVLGHVFDASNHEHIVYPTAAGLYYGKRANGSTTWSLVKLTSTVAGDSYGTLRVRSDGTLVFVLTRYSSSGTGGVFIQTKTPTGAWSTLSRVGATDSSYSLSDVVLDSANAVHVLLRRYTTSATTSGLYYLRKGSSWSAPAKVTGTTEDDYGTLVRDSAKTKIALVVSRYAWDEEGSMLSTLVAIKSAAAAAFPTPTLRAGVGAHDYAIGMTIQGTRAQLYFNRYIDRGATGNGVFMQTATVGGTTASPTLTWRAGAPTRLGGTTYKDGAHDAVLAPNGKVGLVIYKDSTVASEHGLYVAESSTAGAWSTAPVRKTSDLTAMYDYPAALAYNSSSVGSLAFLRH